MGFSDSLIGIITFSSGFSSYGQGFLKRHHFPTLKICDSCLLTLQDSLPLTTWSLPGYPLCLQWKQWNKLTWKVEPIDLGKFGCPPRYSCVTTVPPNYCPITSQSWTGFVLHFISLHYTLNYGTLHCTVVHCITLWCTALHCTELRCTKMHFTALHCTAMGLNQNMNAIQHGKIPSMGCVLVHISSCYGKIDFWSLGRQ